MEEEQNITIWSPSSLVRDYFRCLCRTYDNIHEIEDDKLKKQEILLTIVMAVAVTETFINLYLDIVADERKISKKTLEDPRGRGQTTLEFKINKWPKIIFGEKLNFSTSPFKDFKVLKQLRNDLLHFKPKRVTHGISNFYITSFDFSTYYYLEISQARNAILTVIEVIKELLRLNGIEEEKIKGQLAIWTGYFEEFEL